MIKMKNKNLLIGKALTLASLTLIALSVSTVKVHALGGMPTGGDSALDPVAVSQDGTMTRATFNSNNGSYLPNWYGGNQVFLQAYQGITMYSPLPNPGDTEYSDIRNLAQSYENANIDPGNIPESWILADSSYGNYKLYASQLNDTSLDNLSAGKTYNTVDPYAGTWGRISLFRIFKFRFND